MGLEFCIETHLGGGQPLMEDELRWRATFDGRRTLIKSYF